MWFGGHKTIQGFINVALFFMIFQFSIVNFCVYYQYKSCFNSSVIYVTAINVAQANRVNHK